MAEMGLPAPEHGGLSRDKKCCNIGAYWELPFEFYDQVLNAYLIACYGEARLNSQIGLIME